MIRLHMGSCERENGTLLLDVEVDEKFLVFEITQRIKGKEMETNGIC